ncbi:LamB/YcsF family protein [Neobacillus niacini]|uniref:LamB/YcsF family protein n=1 Tax=Neobacillus niacini TaxID=86668 RepID=UPI0021CB3528|nr:5-oxoprolinase subunit PxpA [Neobacillus niacini]MCM3768699.1 5-oxoprolinase subunit PxpA [Neobacillus niacini]
MKVDLNCDMGESFGLYQIGNDEEMMKYISSANIACGFHGGDPYVMNQTVQLAKKYGVAIGAHPGFPDLMGFGRRYMSCTPEEVKDYVVYQIGALKGFAERYGLELQHCKPHGALYMMAMSDEKLARAILEAIAGVSERMIVFALNNSAVAHVGEEMGIPIAYEVYADREHTVDGSIILTRTGPTIQSYEDMARRVVRMVEEKKVFIPDGEEGVVEVHTVCIHGDTVGAPKLIKQIRIALEVAGITVEPVREIL